MCSLETFVIKDNVGQEYIKHPVVHISRAIVGRVCFYLDIKNTTTTHEDL